MRKTIEQMTEEVKSKNQFFTSDKNGYCNWSIDRVFPSTKRTAIVYQIGGSNWNRGGLHGGGVSKFEGTGVYNGEVDLIVKHYQQWRSGTNYADDRPGNRYYVDGLEELDNGKYRLNLSNCYGKESLIVSFEDKKVSNE
jgi:hypothetical protein